ncbi:MAG: DUF2202 domain-containing protein [Alphaproteobacteria bacterium]|nr:DUF2202 domain-containing protein [Alphaproteobacteria bacterium]
MTTVKKTLAVALAAMLASATFVPAAQAATALPETVQEALLDALNDEYHAEAFYAAVMEKFGATRPFSNIIRSEQMHQSWLADLMTTYGMSVPANAELGSAEIAAVVPATISEACAIGVTAEVDNAALYDDELLPAVAAYPDIAAVFERLSAASTNQHLPAFQRCAG